MQAAGCLSLAASGPCRFAPSDHRIAVENPAQRPIVHEYQPVHAPNTSSSCEYGPVPPIEEQSRGGLNINPSIL
jgi:hypothetical protein